MLPAPNVPKNRDAMCPLTGSPYAVMHMPMHMWCANLDTGAPMVWGVKNVPKNRWDAGPYATQAEALEAMQAIEDFERG